MFQSHCSKAAAIRKAAIAKTAMKGNIQNTLLLLMWGLRATVLYGPVKTRLPQKPEI